MKRATKTQYVIQHWSSVEISQEAGCMETGATDLRPFVKGVNRSEPMWLWAVSGIEVVGYLEAGTAVESGPADAAF